MFTDRRTFVKAWPYRPLRGRYLQPTAAAASGSCSFRRGDGDRFCTQRS
jgi:hypothetical protein